MAARITTAQKDLILSLLREAEFDTHTVGVMFRRLGVADSWSGQRVSVWLDSLTREDASDVIGTLKDMID